MIKKITTIRLRVSFLRSSITNIRVSLSPWLFPQRVPQSCSNQTQRIRNFPHIIIFYYFLFFCFLILYSRRRYYGRSSVSEVPPHDFRYTVAVRGESDFFSSFFFSPFVRYVRIKVRSFFYSNDNNSKTSVTRI